MIKLQTIIDTLFPAYLDFWKTICGMETPSYDREALNKQADVIEAFCKARGFSVRRKQHANAGDTMAIELQGDGAKSHVALLAHMDTVHAPGAFGMPPIREENGILYGPGVFDCKGGIVLCLFTMNILKNLEIPHRTVKLILNSDEENGSFVGEDGGKFIQDEARGACAVFNAESGIETVLTVGRKGIISAQIEVSGIAGHAGNAYFESASAIREAAYKIIELESASDKDVTYNCGIIQGGKAGNIVPDNCKLLVDVRFLSDTQKMQALEVLEKITQKNHVAGCHAVLRIIHISPSMERTEGNLALFELVNQTAQALGMPPFSPIVRGGGSDSAYTVEIGIPTVCSMGPVGRYEHTIQEQADISTLKQRARLLAECILKV